VTTPLHRWRRVWVRRDGDRILSRVEIAYPGHRRVVAFAFNVEHTPRAWAQAVSTDHFTPLAERAWGPLRARIVEHGDSYRGPIE